jgi:hypothetical protein
MHENAQYVSVRDANMRVRGACVTYVWRSWSMLDAGVGACMARGA